MKFLSTIIAILSLSIVMAYAMAPSDKSGENVRRVRIVAAGDLMQHMPQVNAALDSCGRYDYRKSFRHVARIMRGADLAIVNLETTLSDEGPYSGYPSFRSPAAVADAMRDMQIDLAAMANNHCCDRGGAGIRATTRILDSRGIRRTGVYRDSLDHSLNNIHVFRRNGLSLAVINYTYGTNGLPVPKGCMVNHLDTTVMSRDIAAARDLKPDCIIAVVHWGNEYQRHPDAAQRSMAAFMRRHGVDVIIGSHPHVVQPVECDSTQGVTIYSLGNFVSNQRKRYCDGGIIATIDIERKGDGPLTYSLDVTPVWVHMPGYTILPPDVADTMRMNEISRRQYNLFINDTRNLLGLQ